MALDALAAMQPGSVPGSVIAGILALKEDEPGGGYHPLPYRFGPLCELCWLADGDIRAASACGDETDGAQ